MNTTNTQKIEAAEMLLKDTQVILAALKAETEPKREPQAGDVWMGNRTQTLILINNDGKFTQVENGFTQDMPFGNFYLKLYTYIGRSSDVLMLRPEVATDYVTKKELKDYIGAVYTRGEGCTGYDLKTAIIGKFNLNKKYRL